MLCILNSVHTHFVNKGKLDSVKAGGVYIHHYTLEGLKQDYCTYFLKKPSLCKYREKKCMKRIKPTRCYTMDYWTL